MMGGGEDDEVRGGVVGLSDGLGGVKGIVGWVIGGCRKERRWWVEGKG